ncbi:MAG: hypothetical protein SGARI_000493 [Bacillariaceae sp.]
MFGFSHFLNLLTIFSFFLLTLLTAELETGSALQNSCTQVRTHAQKYFLALQKPPLPDGSASGVATKPKKPKASSRKKSKLLFEHMDGSGKKKSSNASAKRGLSGMSLLAQAAMVDQPWQASLDQTAEEFEKAHPQSDDESDEDGDSSGIEDAPPAKKKAKQSQSQSNGYMTAGQEIAMLRAQLQIANESVGLMKKEVQASEARAVDAIEGRNIAIKECRELQEMNSQLKMVMAIEGNGGKGLAAAATSQPQASAVPSAGLDQMQAMAGLFGPQAAMQAASSQSQQFQQQIQQQDQIVIEVLQSRLKEAEIRYHAVTESLARQTQVLTDQHRAILELNCKLEKERSLRENAEMELGNLKRQAGGK